MNKPKWSVCLVLAVLVLAMFGASRIAPMPWAWGLNALFLVAFTMALGRRINNKYLGVLITERNVMSLSRFQLVVWTIIVLSAFVTIALKRVFAGPVLVPDPLAIALPWQLWALMGISTTSLVGSPLISKDKDARQQRATLRRRALARELATDKSPGLTGIPDSVLLRKNDPDEAECADMFRGDETGNNNSIDVAKLQMFYFTIICALAYVVVLGNLMVQKSSSELSSFPVLADGLVALLGISHTGYLTSKGVDHTEPK